MQSLTKQLCDSKDLFQALLAEYPCLLASDQIDKTASRRWLLLSREVEAPTEKAQAT